MRRHYRTTPPRPVAFLPLPAAASSRWGEGRGEGPIQGPNLVAAARYRPRFEPIFESHAAGHVRFAVTTSTIAEVLTGPLSAGEEVLARRYRSILESWQVIALDGHIAESTARMRALFGLKLADAVQVASAIAVNADALVTHDRNFSRVTGLTVIS